MKERPIIFSAPMVRQILSGAKTQTRRIIKRPLSHPNWTGYMLSAKKDEVIECGPDYPDGDKDRYKNPYGVPGDKLWVRETCYAEELEDGSDGVHYVADNHWQIIKDTKEAADKWVALNCYQGIKGAKVPSIFMPRWASRITLEITDIRVQRIQDISEEDAQAEGAEPIHAELMYPDEPLSEYNYRRGFQKLWNSINEKRGFGWSKNNWVFAVSFRRLQP